MTLEKEIARAEATADRVLPAQIARAVAMGKGWTGARDYARRANMVPRAQNMLEKAATSSWTTDSEGPQAGVTVQQLADDLATTTAFFAAWAAGLLTRVPSHTRLIAGVATRAVRSPEGSALPVVAPVVAAQRLEPELVGSLIVATNEVWDRGGASGLQFLRSLLTDAAGRGVDKVFLDAVTDGLTPVSVATPSAVDDIRAAMVSALNMIRTKASARIFWIAAPDTANLLALYPQDFPGVSLAPGATLLGAPFFVSEAAASGTLIALNGTDIGADVEGPFIDISHQATVLMSDDPDADGEDGTLVSLFQSNSSAAKVTVWLTAAPIRANGVAVIDGIGEAS